MTEPEAELLLSLLLISPTSLGLPPNIEVEESSTGGKSTALGTLCPCEIVGFGGTIISNLEAAAFLQRWNPPPRQLVYHMIHKLVSCQDS